MKTGRIVAAAGTLILGLSATVAQAGLVSLDVTIGSQTFTDVTLDTGWATTTGSTDPTHTLNAPVTLTSSDGKSTFTIQQNTQWNPDPFLLFSFNATNNSGSAQNFSVSFSAPLNPTLQGNVTSHATLGVTLTHAPGLDASVTPQGTNPFMLTSYDTYPDLTTVSKNVDIGTAFSLYASDTALTATTTYTADGSLICVQACQKMTADLSFMLSASSSVGFSGAVTQTAVPLPAAGLLFGSGLFGLAGLRRRRKVA